MVVQDDARENELIRLFGLEKGDSRGGTDAFLDLNGQKIPIELKSTTRGSVTTARDFGPEHVEKMKGKHWLIGFYSEEPKLQYCHYGSPDDMTPWIDGKAEYIKPDFQLAELTPDKLSTKDLYEILGRKKEYSLEDAKKLHKRQYSSEEYRQKMDKDEGYTPQAMLEIMKDRCRYLIERGSTLNNPHIPASYFNGWEKIQPGDTRKLKRKIREYIQTQKK